MSNTDGDGAESSAGGVNQTVSLYDDFEFATRCLECGADETDEPGVVVEEIPSDAPDLRDPILEQVTRTYRCEECGVEETVNQSVPSATFTDSFGITEAPLGERMRVLIDGNEIQYREMEESLVGTTLYNRAGMTTHGRTQQVRIQAFNPPTLSKGAHDVQIGEFVDQRMMLVGIKYYTSDDPWRGLTFHRGLDQGIINMLKEGRHRER